MEEDTIALIAAIILVIILLPIGWLWSSYQCSSKWEGSGMQTSWGIVKGCQVEVHPGRWMPSERIRDIPSQDISK